MKNIIIVRMGIRRINRPIPKHIVDIPRMENQRIAASTHDYDTPRYCSLLIHILFLAS
jgi:hypothetical protein